MQDNFKRWEHDGNKITLQHNFYDPREGGTRWVTFVAEKDSIKDEFEFSVPVFEAFKYPDRDFDEYIDMAIENITNYLRRFGIRGNQAHIFDFWNSNFIPRERIDWP